MPYLSLLVHVELNDGIHVDAYELCSIKLTLFMLNVHTPGGNSEPAKWNFLNHYKVRYALVKAQDCSNVKRLTNIYCKAINELAKQIPIDLIKIYVFVSFCFYCCSC